LKGFKKGIRMLLKKFATERHTWSTWHNFYDMYEHTYDEMVSAGVAEKRCSPVWLNWEGKKVSKEEYFGRQATHLLLHTDCLLFVDKVGSNTDMEGDGHFGGELMVIGRGETA
jgi:hypothetical protein